MNTFLLSLAVTTCAWLSEPPAATAPQLSPSHAARLYRIAIYDTFRTERPEYAKRRELGEQLWHRFEAAGLPKQHQAEVTQWFVQAREASLPGQIQDLPPLPDFQVQPRVADTEQPSLQLSPASTLPVSTAMELPAVDLTRDDTPPAGAVTTLDVRLPPEAVQTGPTRFFSGLIKQAFPVSTQAHEAPVSHRLPKAQLQVTPELAPPNVTLPPQADQVHPHLELPNVPLTKKPDTKPEPAPFNFDHLFEPTTTPVPQASSDPFAP